MVFFSFLDSQKAAFTFYDRSAFVSLNVSLMKELKFKFRLLKSEENKIIATVHIPDYEKDLTVGNVRLNLRKFLVEYIRTSHFIEQEGKLLWWK